MVKYRLNGQFYDTTPETVEEMEIDSKLLPGSGSSSSEAEEIAEAEEIRKSRASPPATKIIEDCYDNLGRPRVKIIYLDVGYKWCKLHKVDKCIREIRKAEWEKEITEGKPGPRLIFVKQDMDYWPGSEMNPGVMDRRAAKQRAYNSYKRNPDHKAIYVPYVHEEATEEATEEEEDFDVFYDKGTDEDLFYEKIRREWFATYFDPSLPGTKFIVETMAANLCDMFRECMEVPDFFNKWKNSSLAGFLESLGYKMNMLEEDIFAFAGHSGI